ncbi:MAG: hypothetical protein NHB15_16900 [Methanosarcina barkeri]|nr:hypothetical protein [Methanosarcina sp. ERenArc_MAG2]
MASQNNISRKWPLLAPFHVDKIYFVRVTANTRIIQTQAERQEVTTKDPKGTNLHGDFGLKYVPTTSGQVRAAYHSSVYENKLRDIYFEVTLNTEVDEQLAVELFQAFGPLIAVKFKNGVFTRTGL